MLCGKESLKIAFWIYGILAQIIIIILSATLSYVVLYFLVTQHKSELSIIYIYKGILLLIGNFSFLYGVITSIGIWRCAL
jgi:hypothetical protein